jgi:hypothetical protein
MPKLIPSSPEYKAGVYLTNRKFGLGRSNYNIAVCTAVAMQ